MSELTDSKRSQIGQAVLLTMADWKISDKQQIQLLGLNIKPRRLPELAQGKTPLPDDEAVLNRAKHILGIGAALHGFFPLNQHGGSIWLKNTNKYFLKKAPLDCMLEDNLPGMHKVWANLDCTQGWD